MARRIKPADRLRIELANSVVNGVFQERVRELGHDVLVSKLSPFEVIPKKGYTARAQADVAFMGRPLGNGTIYAVLFGPGDGTGARKGRQSDDPLDGWFPRKKTDHVELGIAIGTGYDRNWRDGLNHLLLTDYSGQPGKSVIKVLTVSRDEFQYGLLKPYGDVPHFAFTLDRGARVPYGDPHAVVFNGQGLDEGGIFQVMGFLGFEKDGEDLEMVRDVTGLGNKSLGDE